MNKYEILFTFNKKDLFILLGMYLFFYGILNFIYLFLKDIFSLIFK